MEKTERHASNSNTHTDMRKEPMRNAAPVVANKCDLDDDPELQYLDQQAEKNLNNSKKKSFFQITSVTENVNDENDSMDELDESRADDLSTADLSKLSLQTDVEQSEAEDSPNPPGVGLNPNAALNPNAEANGNGPSRFKLVKVARIEPIKRGRWTCKDFPNEPQPGAESGVAKSDQLRDNVSGSSSAASSVHYVPGENPPTENPLGDMNSASQQPPPPSKDKAAKDATRNKKDSSSLAGHRPSSKSFLSKKDSSAGDLLSLDSLNVDIHADNLSESDESTSATGGAIDNKIEQAMDLVKSHLLFAVREEVEVLKEQIKELLEKNEQLQRENNVLRQNQSQGLPPHLPFNQSETPQATRQHVGAPKATQDQGGFQSLPGPAVPRPEGYQQQPGAGEQQFVGIQAGGGPAHGQAPTQQQALPQQQAGQYGHIQPTQPPQQHTLPQQTSTQHNQPPSQT